ncbi:MAG: porin family protein [Legionella sp.]|nr:porin family protein [Legionella sp.]
MTLMYRIMFVVINGLFFISTLHAAIITFSPGIAVENNAQTQTLLLQTSPQNFSNQYVENHAWKHRFLAQLFLGKRLHPQDKSQDKLNLDLGATLGFVNDIKINGVINQFGLSDFDNLTYQYTVDSLSAMGTIKLLYPYSKYVQPYLNGSLGLSNNRSSFYQETPRILGAVPMLPFGDHSTHSFAYNAGVGLMYYSNEQFSVGLGYQFSDLGKASLSTSPAQQTMQTLSLNHLYLHQLLFNFTWDI